MRAPLGVSSGKPSAAKPWRLCPLGFAASGWPLFFSLGFALGKSLWEPSYCPLAHYDSYCAKGQYEYEYEYEQPLHQRNLHRPSF